MKKGVWLVTLSTLLVVGCGEGGSGTSGRTVNVSQNVCQPKSAQASSASRTDERNAPTTSASTTGQTASESDMLPSPSPHVETHTQPGVNAVAPATQPSAGTNPAVRQSMSPQTGGGTVNVNYWNHEPPLVTRGKTVVLTFDDGPSPWTAALISTLDEESVPAVMFWNTYHISFANDKVRTLLKTSPNIQVGDHTVDHPNLLKLTYRDQYREIADAKQVIEDTTGSAVQFFRPPYGNYNGITTQVLGQLGLSSVMWDVDSLDWQYNSNETAILNEIKYQLRPGAIILMHDHYYTERYLSDIIAMLRKAGYGFTTITKEKQ